MRELRHSLVRDTEQFTDITHGGIVFGEHSHCLSRLFARLCFSLRRSLARRLDMLYQSECIDVVDLHRHDLDLDL